jgi:hypothetical protein
MQVSKSGVSENLLIRGNHLVLMCSGDTKLGHQFSYKIWLTVVEFVPTRLSQPFMAQIILTIAIAHAYLHLKV